MSEVHSLEQQGTEQLDAREHREDEARESGDQPDSIFDIVVEDSVSPVDTLSDAFGDNGESQPSNTLFELLESDWSSEVGWDYGEKHSFSDHGRFAITDAAPAGGSGGNEGGDGGDDGGDLDKLARELTKDNPEMQKYLAWVSITDIRPSEEVNAELREKYERKWETMSDDDKARYESKEAYMERWVDPYKPGTWVVEGTVQESFELFRIHGESNPISKWFSGTDLLELQPDLQPLEAEQALRLFADYAPTPEGGVEASIDRRSVFSVNPKEGLEVQVRFGELNPEPWVEAAQERGSTTPFTVPRIVQFEILGDIQELVASGAIEYLGVNQLNKQIVH